MSWESSALNYRLVNGLARDRLGGLHSARCIMASVDFADIEALQSIRQWDTAGELLALEAQRLEAAGLKTVGLLGTVSEPSRRRYLEVIESLAERGAEGIILGCTEIELLIDQHAGPLPVFPTTRLHAEAAVGLALGDGA